MKKRIRNATYRFAVPFLAVMITCAFGGILVMALLLSFPAPGLADMETALWVALRSGDHVALMRHALAPGTDDPPGFRLDDCRVELVFPRRQP